MLWTGLVLEGSSDPMQKLRQQLQQVSRRREPMLLVGENGSGLRGIAHAVYLESPSASTPFHIVDCRLPLAELRILGNSSALGKGLLLRPSPCALLLEEVAALSPSFCTQIGDHLLHDPLGTKPWILASTSESNSTQIEELCLHLFAGLPVKVVRVPPLRERGNDIYQLLFRVLELIYEGREAPGITASAQQLLVQQPWHLNLMELTDFVVRLAAGHEGDEPITREDVQGMLESPGTPVVTAPVEDMPIEALLHARLSAYLDMLGPSLPEGSAIYKQLLPFFERPLLQLVLERTKGNQLQAAQILGINRNTLRKKCQLLEIEPNDFREPS